ncbi:MAG: chromosomal replication initiator protein DnaA [Bacteroidales bacterium]|jgi:chromosomal replication initiator protein|nr:chromosomal replication initiator protein DnaA [Bacteroidales bacterium]
MTTNYEETWAKCLNIIQENLPKPVFNTFFAPIVPIELKGSLLTIQVQSQFVYEYLEAHCLDLMARTLHRVIGPDAKLEYRVVMCNQNAGNLPTTIRIPSNEGSKNVPNEPKIQPKGAGEHIPPYIIPGLKKIQIDPHLNPEYTFDNYVEGECNRMARAAGFAVAGNPAGTPFNPLFIYGGSGLGKTHLANAIGLEVKKNFPEKVVLYVDANKFLTQYIQATRDNNRNDFIHFYQMIDVLILDDVQYFADKQGTQEVFFQIFNHLHQHQKQLILTSDKAPVDLNGMEERLLSRFKWGLAADLQEPDFETRIKILKRKTYKDGIEIKEEILEYIASHVTNNVRELEGTLISLLAQATLNKKEITLELAKGMIDKLVKNTQREISIDYIQKVVCNYFSMSVDVLSSKTRKREIVQARQIAMYFAKNMTKCSLAVIGNAIGNKDHATVLHACKTVNNLIETDKAFKQDLEEIEKRLKM